MRDSSILLGSLYVGASALNAFSKGVQATAHNLANVSTANFKPAETRYNERPAGQGVDAALVLRSSEQVETAAYVDMSSAGNMEQPGGTEIAKEISFLIMSERAFQANAKTITVTDQLIGYVLDTKS